MPVFLVDQNFPSTRRMPPSSICREESAEWTAMGAVSYTHLAVASPELEVLGITTCMGNQPIENTTQNTLELVRYLKADIPVARGSQNPLVRQRWVGNPEGHRLPIPDLSEEVGPLQEKSAVEFMVDVLRSSEDVYKRQGLSVSKRGWRLAGQQTSPRTISTPSGRGIAGSSGRANPRTHSPRLASSRTTTLPRWP